MTLYSVRSTLESLFQLHCPPHFILSLYSLRKAENDSQVNHYTRNIKYYALYSAFSRFVNVYSCGGIGLVECASCRQLAALSSFVSYYVYSSYICAYGLLLTKYS